MITRPVTSIVDEPATTAEFDVLAAWKAISYGDWLRLARLGAIERYYSIAGGYIQFDATLHGLPKLRVIVKLMPDDTYAVEVGQIKRRSGGIVYNPLVQDRDLHCDNVGAAMEELVKGTWVAVTR